MKKIIAAIFALILMSGVAVAENVDLSALSDVDLLQLRSNIEVELANRGLETENLIEEGTYLVGRDIIEGQFSLLAACEYGMGVYIFETQEDYSAYFKEERFTNGEETAAIEAHAMSETWIYEGKSTSFNLKEGMVLLLENGPGKLTTQNKSWAL